MKDIEPAPAATRTTETVINYVVEVRVPGKPWLTQYAGEYEQAGRQNYDQWRKGRGSLEVRLIKRTAAITDEVLKKGVQGQ